MKKKILFSTLLLLLCVIFSAIFVSCNKNKFNFEEEVKKIEVRLIDENKELSQITNEDIEFFNCDKKLNISIISLEKDENFVTINFKVKYEDKEKLLNTKIKVNSQGGNDKTFNFEEEVKKIEVRLIDENKELSQITNEDIEFFNYDKKLNISIISLEKDENFVTINFKVKYEDKEENKKININLPKIEDFNFNYLGNLTSLELMEEHIQIESLKNFKIFSKTILSRKYDNVQLEIKTNNGITVHKNLITNTEKFKNEKEIDKVHINKYGLILELLNAKGYFANCLKPSKIAKTIEFNSTLNNEIVSLKIIDVAYDDGKNEMLLKVSDFKILETLINIEDSEIKLTINPTSPIKIKSDELERSINLDYQDLLIKNKIKLTEFLKNGENLAKLIRFSTNIGLSLYEYEIRFYNIKEKQNNVFSYMIQIKEIQYKKVFGEGKEVVGEVDLFDEIKNFEDKYYSGEDVLDYITKNEITKNNDPNLHFPSFYKETIDKAPIFAKYLINISNIGEEIFKDYFGMQYTIDFDLYCNNFNDLDGTLSISVNVKAHNEDLHQTIFSKILKDIDFLNLPKFGDINKETIFFPKVIDEKFKNQLKELIKNNKEFLINNNDLIIDNNNEEFKKLFLINSYSLDLSNEAATSTLDKYNNTYSKHMQLFLGDNNLEFNEIFTNEKYIYFLKLGVNKKYIALDGITVNINSLKINIEEYNENNESKIYMEIEFSVKYTFKNSSAEIESKGLNSRFYYFEV